jgi:hypothetical protein
MSEMPPWLRHLEPDLEHAFVQPRVGRKRAPDDLFGSVPEHPLDRRVHLQDGVIEARQNDRICAALKQRPLAAFGLAAGFLAVRFQLPDAGRQRGQLGDQLVSAQVLVCHCDSPPGSLYLDDEGAPLPGQRDSRPPAV